MNNGSVLFDEWIINNFGLNKNNGVHVKKNKVDTVQAMIDKKLTEKKNSLNASSGKKRVSKK
jgi:uncharacterized metal-binding protein